MSNYLKNRNECDLFDNRFLNALFGDDKDARAMKTDIVEVENGYELEVDLPGYSKDEVKINYEKGYLTVKAETKKETEDNKKVNNFIKRERFYGEVSRTYYLGEDINDEEIKATFTDGVLKICVPKQEKKVETKKYISIE